MQNEKQAELIAILLRNTYPNEFPILINCEMFGQQIYDDINLSASDHYGVVVKMNFDNLKEINSER